MSIKSKSFDLLSAGSMGADITTDSFSIEFNYGAAIQCVWSDGSTPTGNMIIQASCDQTKGNTVTPGNWTDVTGTSTAVSGNSGSIIYNISEANFSALRVFYDRTGGSGTLDIRVIIKGV